MPDSPPNAVFLSYAREDADAARRIAEALRSQGVEVWFDQNELRGGDAWDQKIRRQIKECSLFVPIVSAHTQGRGEGYFRLEWRLAAERTHLMAEGVPFLAPVTVDETTDAGAVAPGEFLKVQWTRLPGGLPTPAFVDQVKRLLQQPRRPGVASAFGAPPASSPGAGAGPRRLAWSVAGLAVVLLGLGAAFFLRRPGGTPPPPLPAGAATAVEKSIAVLPLANLSTDRENGFFADGVHDELITDLAAIADLKVISRTSVLQYRDTRSNLRDIGRELGVAYVLEGSVRREGSQVRITAQLIDTRTDGHVWAGTFDEKIADVFVLQATLAREIAAALQARLTPQEAKRIERERGASPEVYEMAQRARAVIFSTESTRENYAAAVTLAQQAVERQPNFAFGWATLGHIHVAFLYRGFDPTDQRRAEAKAALDRALAIDPDLPEAHWALGRLYQAGTSGKNLAATGRLARLELERARKSLPNEPRILTDLASVLYYRDDDDAGALALQRRALELNPNDPLAHYNIARMLDHAGRPREALGHLETALRMNPVFVGAACWVADLRLDISGDLDGARRAVDGLPAGLQDDRLVLYRYLMASYARDFPAALRILRESPVAYFRDNYFTGPRELLEGRILGYMGDAKSAREKFRVAWDKVGAEGGSIKSFRNSVCRAEIAAALGDEGHAQEALQSVRHALVDLPRLGLDINECEAFVYASLGRADPALDALEYLVQHHALTPNRLRVDPIWDGLRRNPRFQKLLLAPQPKE